ncbi:MAG: hypothetical protein M3499_03530, partial [Actinomycetota bacterium]|nr:hypothetical protein [Actinomycetota bacterium]
MSLASNRAPQHGAVPTAQSSLAVLLIFEDELNQLLFAIATRRTRTSTVLSALFEPIAVASVIEQVYDGFMVEATLDSIYSDVAGVCGHVNAQHARLVRLTQRVVSEGVWE